ncbi:MAG: hypothetical protein AB7G48_10740 [Nitrospiraceae bacterium]
MNRLGERLPIFQGCRFALVVVLVSIGLSLFASPAKAEWRVNGMAILFWTDDIGIFSATRRLSRDGDPTQPALDSRLTDKGSSFGLDPQLTVSNTVHNRLGKLELSARGQGFIFTEDSRFNQGMLRLQAIQAFSSETRLRLRYEYMPNQFLGDNEDRRPGELGLAEEILTSSIWSARIEQRLTPDLDVMLLGRFGTRRYNDAFAERDTNFWTIGPHVDWRVSRRVKLGFGYHFEQGLADGRNQPQFEDDVSYINHYLTTEVDIELTERWSLQMAAHYERNIWTSTIVGDERNGAHETIVQGELILVRQVTERVQAFAGFQRSSRKQSFETDGVKNTNVGIGISATF